MTTFILLLLLAAAAVVQTLIGGAKLVYSLPAYGLLGVAGVMAVWVLRRKTMVLPRFWCVPAVLIMAGYLGLRALLSPVSYLARQDFFLVAAAVVVYLLTILVLNRTSRRLTVFWALMVLAVGHVVAGIIQFRQGNNFMALPWVFRADYGRRASGFYICPNHLAGLLEMLGLLSIAICCWARGKLWLRIFSGYSAVVCLTGLAITGSRGGFVALAVGCLALAGFSAYTLRKLKRAKLVNGVLMASAAFGVLVGGSLWLTLRSEALAQRVDTVYEPTNMRLQMWSAALRQFRLEPIFGTGSGTYYYYGRQFREPQMQADPLHVHNDYLELLAEYGVVGVLLTAGVFGVHLYSGWRGISRIVRMKLRPTNSARSTDLAFTLGALSGTVALLVHSVVDFNLHLPGNTLLLAFLFGVMANPANIETRGQEREGVPLWLQFTPAALGAALAAVTLLFLPAEVAGEQARVALRDGDFAAARARAEQALRSEKRNPDLYFYLGEAQHYLALASEQQEPRVQLQLGTISAFQEGLRIFPQDVRLLLKLGRTYDALNVFAAAEELYQRAFQADPKFGKVYAYYALHCQLQGRRDEAERYYTTADSFGERQISAAGLADLARENRVRRGAVMSVVGEFVTPSEEERLSPEAAPLLSQP